MTAQTNSIQASWTEDQKVVLNALPVTGQTISLPITTELKQKFPDLINICEKMKTHIVQWEVSDDGSAFIVTLDRNAYPQWGQKDWQFYLNRLVNSYLPKG
jgi:hypothetical protein